MLRVHWLIWVFNIVQHVKEICRQYSPTNFVQILIVNWNKFSIARLSNTHNKICTQLSVCNSCMKLLFSAFSIENKIVGLWMTNFRYLFALHNNFWNCTEHAACSETHKCNLKQFFVAILMISHIHSQRLNAAFY